MYHLEIIEVVLVHYNIANNDCQQDLKVLCTFVSNKLFGQALDTSPKNFIFQKLLIQNFHTLNCGVLIRILNH